MLAKLYHLGLNWPTTLCKNKDGVHFFTRNFECDNRYNKLLLCNSENGDIAWCNKNNSECFFPFSLKKEQNLALKKTKNPFFLEKNGFFSNLANMVPELLVFENTFSWSLKKNEWKNTVGWRRLACNVTATSDCSGLTWARMICTSM